MANPEHLEILKQGVDVWNQWREDNPDIRPDLSDIALHEVDLTKINFLNALLAGSAFTSSILFAAIFSDSNIIETTFAASNLFCAKFDGAWATYSDFRRANLRNSHFQHAHLMNSNFAHAILCGTDLSGADLSNAELSYANIENGNLVGSKISNVDFISTNLTEAQIGYTVFSNCDLNVTTIGLDRIIHLFPSTIGIDTLIKSQDIPEIFLRGCGVPKDFITYAKSLTTNPIDFYSCFISFTEKDDAFSERLYNDMQMAGIRCWRWKEDAKWGRTLRKEIDEAVRYYDKLVVICSKDSLNAPAVLEEIERALDKEDDLKRKGEDAEVLFPIRIDDFIFDGWDSELKVRLTKKNIGDFCGWNGDAEKYRKSVDRLVRDLNRPRNEK